MFVTGTFDPNVPPVPPRSSKRELPRSDSSYINAWARSSEQHRRAWTCRNIFICFELYFIMFSVIYSIVFKVLNFKFLLIWKSLSLNQRYVESLLPCLFHDCNSSMLNTSYVCIYTLRPVEMFSIIWGPSQKLPRPNLTVVFHRICRIGSDFDLSDSVGFHQIRWDSLWLGRIRSDLTDLIGFGRLDRTSIFGKSGWTRSDSVGFAWICSDEFGRIWSFGDIRSDSVGFGLIW